MNASSDEKVTIFEDLQAWRRARELVRGIYTLPDSSRGCCNSNALFRNC